MTWPWVLHLRDAVYDNGDSYAFAWSLWWNYHQVFHDPLNLFQANIFFPYRYTLAFTEHDFGISLVFFPLFALGLRPLSVLSIATLCGFAFCGYGAFRLTRTLTGSVAAAWVAGVVYAFIPYRFMLLPHLPYLFAPWIPLLLEALILFLYVRSWKRAAWLGTAFLMTGLSSITWLLFSLIPLALTATVLIIRHRIGRERAFWMRGFVMLTAALLLLLPFIWPYYKASKLYGFERSSEEVAHYSARLVDWLAAPHFTRVWAGMGLGRPDVTSTLFPGLIPLLLSLAAVLLIRKPSGPSSLTLEEADRRRRTTWLYILDTVALVSFVVTIVAAGFSIKPGGALVEPFQFLTPDRVLFVFSIVLITRFCIAYPQLLRRGEGTNLLESLRSDRRDDAFWIGVVCTVSGFLCAIGMNSFFYRVLYDLLFPFHSLRVPARAAMVCYIGLALLAGQGAIQVAARITNWRTKVRPWMVYSILVGAVLVEFHAAPLEFMRGEVSADAVSGRLKSIQMRGGVVDLPSQPDPPYYTWHLSMLRAADHEHPVIFAASSFYPYLTMKVHDMTKGPGIAEGFLDLLEEIPASYVVMRWRLLVPERHAEFKTFFANGVTSGRLRLIGNYGDDELYAIVKTEPDAR